jgi:MioC protein
MEVNLNYLFNQIADFSIKLLATKKDVKRQPKTHDYTQYSCNHDYIFEVAERENWGYMTGQGQGINQGDYLILSSGSNTLRYQVESVDYYSNPPDMWIALLRQVSREQ